MTIIEIIEMTPQMAVELLEHNDVNRPLRQHRVDQYADAIDKGNWALTGDPIVIDRNGRLMQGQHRLRACIKANRSFKTAVLRGADPASYAVMDSGLGRKASDVLAHAGHSNATTIAAATKLVLGYESATLHDANQWARVATRLAIEREANEYRDAYMQAATEGKMISRASRLSASAITAFQVLLFKRGELHRPWFESLKTGANLDVGDPILTVRQYGLGPVSKGQIVQLSALIRAWNAWVYGRRLMNIKTWIRGTPFPIIFSSKQRMELAREDYDRPEALSQ